MQKVLKLFMEFFRNLDFCAYVYMKHLLILLVQALNLKKKEKEKNIKKRQKEDKERQNIDMTCRENRIITFESYLINVKDYGGTEYKKTQNVQVLDLFLSQCYAK